MELFRLLLLWFSFVGGVLEKAVCPDGISKADCKLHLGKQVKKMLLIRNRTAADCLAADNIDRISSYFINTPGTPRRRLAMERQFKMMRLKPNRVAGSTVKEIHVARQDNFTFKFGPGKLAASPDEAIYIVDFLHGWYDTKLRWGYDNSNTVRELSCFLSHLMAIREAVYSNECTRYALIMEDDIFFGYVVNFKALLLTAQKDFGTLQLHTNNPGAVKSNFEDWLDNTIYIWRTRRVSAKWWSAGAYIIDKVKWRPIIDKLMYMGSDSKWHFTIIAGNKTACLPSICCRSNNTFIEELPCFAAWSGYQADAIIYEYLPTYFFRLPLFNVFPDLSLNSSVQTSNYTVRTNFTNIVFETTADIFHKFYNGTYVLPPAFAKLLPKENMMLSFQSFKNSVGGIIENDTIQA